MIGGSLFARDFLIHKVDDLPAWQNVSEENLVVFKNDLQEVFDKFPATKTPNESQTENDLIWPILSRLGWADTLRNQNLSAKGRENEPDGLLFLNAELKEQANTLKEWQRYRLGASLVESKRWNRPLDRRSGQKGDSGTPSTQILKYLKHADEITEQNLRWGILTNGRLWRLYWQGAKSRAEDFFEIDLGQVFGLTDGREVETTGSEVSKARALKLFMLMFGRPAFIPGADGQTVHATAIAEGRFYEERIAESLSGKIFDHVYPKLANAIHDKSPGTPLDDIRNATLIALYRLLFLLYAEDRDLLPTNESRYDDYGLRKRVREDVRRRLGEGDAFSETASEYWGKFSDLSRIIDKGDKSIGMPPYNGGLFDTDRTPLLDNVRIPDSIMADIISAMCLEQADDGSYRYINYRDLSVQQLGSIYEKLLEYVLVENADGQTSSLETGLQIFARKGSGSYYTPDGLVGLIIDETLTPLVERAYGEFENGGRDVAQSLLDLKICDPAMGSGHFLVSLVDWLADHVITAIGRAEDEGVTSPVIDRIEKIRATILQNAKAKNWSVNEDQLDDKNLIRRMILKRCVFGVDKNPMAVELAKVSLWLHTFTVGAPLSFLDHHLKCGDSLFGEWVYNGVERAEILGGSLLAHPLTSKASQAEKIMELVEKLPDTEISEVEQSKSLYEDVLEAIQPLNRLLSVMHALSWLNPKGEDKKIINAFFGDHFGRMEDILLWGSQPNYKKKNGERFREIWQDINTLIAEEHFFHWQVSYPGVWERWKSPVLHGGFDAVIGNPPWDRIKLQQVEWFEARRPEIARLPRAADRKKAIRKLQTDNDPLYEDYTKADLRARQRLDVARKKEKDGGNYPWLGRGDIDIYALFVERADQLLNNNGVYGLVVPSGIAFGKTAAEYFKHISSNGRLKTLYDFENKKFFFKDVHASKKFSVIVATKSSDSQPCKCAFYLHNVGELRNENKRFELTSEDFSRINPNTGTAPIFRTRRDAELTRHIYEHLPVLVDHSDGGPVKTWPVKYVRMFDMANASHLFRTKKELLEVEKAWSVSGGMFEDKKTQYMPLFQGKCLALYNHRSAGVYFDSGGGRRPFKSIEVSTEELKKPEFRQTFHFYVDEKEVKKIYPFNFVLAYIRSTATTNARTMVSTLAPNSAYGDSIFLYLPEGSNVTDLIYLQGNFGAIPYDFVARQKVGGENFSKYIVEQLPVVPPDVYDTTKFGNKTAGEIVREAVLELTYTAHDMAPFARDMGYVDDVGDVKPPFVWDEERRLYLRAKLDALYFILYGITDPQDVKYIYSTFPIVERQEKEKYGRYQSRDLCLMWINALQAGKPDAEIRLSS